MFILVTCGSQYDLYLLSFSSSGSNFYFSKISSFLVWSKRVSAADHLKILISIEVNLFFLSLFYKGQIFASISKKRRASTLQ